MIYKADQSEEAYVSAMMNRPCLLLKGGFFSWMLPLRAVLVTRSIDQVYEFCKRYGMERIVMNGDDGYGNTFLWKLELSGVHLRRALLEFQE